MAGATPGEEFMSARLLYAASAAGFLIAYGAAAQQKPVQFHATLDAASEVPPAQSSATGGLKATLDPQAHELKYTLTYENLSAPPTAAHFHGPADPGKNVGVQAVIDPPLASPATGTVKLSSEQESELQAGKWYVNVHTKAHPSGEIRGQMEKEGGR
jgi:CHRD domain-containing protein